MINMSIKERISALRDIMKRENLDAFIFPSTDPHNGEYIPEHWEGRKWISGFNGSAGIAVVTQSKAALWTDSRYFIAAEEQLKGSGFELMKEKVPGTPSISKWLGINLAYIDNPSVGIDGMVNSENMVHDLIYELRNEGGITLRTNFDPLKFIWKDRPPIPENKVKIHSIEYAGESCRSKIKRIREKLKDSHACGILISALDDIAWTLNLRGSDVRCNPVFVSYLLINSTDVTLFINNKKLDDINTEYLKNEGVSVDEYENINKVLKQYSDYNILLDPDEINYTLYNIVRCKEIVKGKSPVAYMKTIKNTSEIRGFKNAMIRDGIALVKFLMWLKPAVSMGDQTEMSIDEKLTALRAEQHLYQDISFDTIAAYKEHGAIVHYEATKETDMTLSRNGLILIDSGAQYLDGTTDITRTIALGDVSDEEKYIYTLVLKGHIQLEMLKFPKGASGTQLDAIAKKDMWREGLNYLHGTGHGVGSYLNVHEGNHQIRMEWKPAPLLSGMTVTDEPGLYLPGRFGVRIENTLLIKQYKTTEFGEFLEFEPLTLCPIDTFPIVKNMMTDEEIQWLNQYHKVVYEQLSPYLNKVENDWLKASTMSISK